MKPRLAMAAAAALAACSLSVEPRSAPRIVLTPVLDSVFVGAQLSKRQVTYYDVHGAIADPGAVQWISGDSSVLAVDGTTGTITGRQAGVASVFATAGGAEGDALVVVSPALKATILNDTIYLMPGDTLTVPVAVDHQAPGVPQLWFTPDANPVFTVDSGGHLTATAPGGPTRFIAHARLNTDTVADSGTVQVVALTDTIGGRAYYASFWTTQRARKVAARATVYPRVGGGPTFQLGLTIVQNTDTTEAVDMVLRTPPAGPGVFVIDSLSPAEATAPSDPFCKPPRDWGRWFTHTASARIDGLSRAGGHITINQIVTIPNGFAISGQFYLPVQPTNSYDDPSAVLPIYGSFVAPLIDIAGHCG